MYVCAVEKLSRQFCEVLLGELKATAFPTMENYLCRKLTNVVSSWDLGKRCKEHGVKFSRFCPDTLSQEMTLCARILRVPGMLEHKFIANAPNDAN